MKVKSLAILDILFSYPGDKPACELQPSLQGEAWRQGVVRKWYEEGPWSSYHWSFHSSLNVTNWSFFYTEDNQIHHMVQQQSLKAQYQQNQKPVMEANNSGTKMFINCVWCVWWGTMLKQQSIDFKYTWTLCMYNTCGCVWTDGWWLETNLEASG